MNLNAKRDPGGRFVPKRSKEDVEAEQAVAWLRRVVERVAEIDPETLVAIMVFGFEIDPVCERFLHVLRELRAERDAPPIAPTPPQPAAQPIAPAPPIERPEDDTPLGEDEIEIEDEP